MLLLFLTVNKIRLDLLETSQFLGNPYTEIIEFWKCMKNIKHCVIFPEMC